VKNGKKALVGTEEGAIDIFDFGWWGDFTDRFIGHPSAVQSIVSIDQVRKNYFSYFFGFLFLII
jgi:hypothetical protein